jgi:predicted nucleic acid-binding protein
MSLIVDNNVAVEFFCGSTPDLQPLKQAVLDAICCLYYGGQLQREYFRSEKVRRMVKQFDQAGRAKKVSDTAVDKKTDEVKPKCVSDDPHVIALALVSGARLLCSRDQDLHTDFKNPELINSPRGHVYQNASHEHLIRLCCQGG